ncbi:permease [Candidatus Desantisbacteria bacterium CG2_30_40_21]|uniref:Probable membrane transporter protein n=5 Tax=unclassified Candidatus Desantisiibacteriota TaxID=3106372 RepID=A0A2M7JCX2_9BACT|nr:MAG: permease [Candidatus Desantisbacteria bacterium CG2_30_40_21]PIP41489.1 MAG: permease [Candidatus Desantisbacteria bacterium CG23_combo_of_CG06-09_8_20_14_all_40_23]PIX17265.1 MAG: permease [Candidatus Desantisbacteria bacterium CG_4_8_14_3_um_filter_40_12]PIY19897.1 MAG: permease [Candidatus Desantisbacteria bacterium CG_4_10_14_3_um_filter_40_18]PJB29151.1 MAG: permease [Candidatus Desantisbacteria bacterium CG_4_9_14_3_um_filter_40_11]
MYFYLPVALTSINIFIPVGIGLAVGLLLGLFGVGGGFLITPLLIMFGIPSTVAAATGLNQIVGASTSGTYAHWRVGNVDFKMGFHLLSGGFIGGLFGVHAIKILRAMGNADFAIKMTYVLMLGIVGTYMFIESIQSMRKKKVEKVEEVKPERKSGISGFLKSLPLQTYYEKSGVTHSALVPIILGVFVGILAAIMGVGGGFLMVPVMIYMLRIPMHVMVGTSLFQILFICIEVTFLQAYINHTVDFILSVLLLLGSTIGAQIGVVFNRRLKTEQLKILLASIVLAVTVKIILELTLTPSLLLSQAGGHG